MANLVETHEKYLQQGQVFNQIWAGAKSQGFHRSMSGSDDAGTCLYRGEGGMKCNVGHLIPDDRFKPEWEKEPIGGVIFNATTACDLSTQHGLSSEDKRSLLRFLEDCQDAHDEGATPARHKGRLVQLAIESDLTIEGIRF